MAKYYKILFIILFITKFYDEKEDFLMETKKNIFEQKWVFWVSLILLPPLAFWLIMCENYDFTEKQTKALKIGTGIWMVLWVLSARSVTSNNKYNADEAKQQTVVEQNVSNDVQVVDSQTTEVKQATNTANEKAGERLHKDGWFRITALKEDTRQTR